jgi:hypothetical protein
MKDTDNALIPKDCYVMNVCSGAVLPDEVNNKDATIFYPETRMTTEECFKTSRPSEYHIVTDCPFLVSLYETRHVWIWRDGKWIHPDFNTFGASYSMIIMNLFDYPNTIPQAIINGKTTNCMGYNRKNREVNPEIKN